MEDILLIKNVIEVFTSFNGHIGKMFFFLVGLLSFLFKKQIFVMVDSLIQKYLSRKNEQVVKKFDLLKHRFFKNVDSYIYDLQNFVLKDTIYNKEVDKCFIEFTKQKFEITKNSFQELIKNNGFDELSQTEFNSKMLEFFNLIRRELKEKTINSILHNLTSDNEKAIQIFEVFESFQFITNDSTDAQSKYIVLAEEFPNNTTRIREILTIFCVKFEINYKGINESKILKNKIENVLK